MASLWVILLASFVDAALLKDTFASTTGNANIHFAFKPATTNTISIDKTLMPSSPSLCTFLEDDATPHLSWGKSSLSLRLNGNHYSTQVQTPSRTGVFNLVYKCGAKNVTVQVELTCSDFQICNGLENYVITRINNGNPVYACQKPPKQLCDDGIACTRDACNSQGICSHTTSSASCPSCVERPCTPDCDGKVCGDDGCGGTCSPGCPADQPVCSKTFCQAACTPSCTANQCSDDGCGGACPCDDASFCDLSSLSCRPYPSGGSCDSLIDISSSFSGGGGSWGGTPSPFYDDNERLLDQITPKCNLGSTAGDVKYLIHTPSGAEGYGLQAYMASPLPSQRDVLDTVLFLVEVPSGMTPSAACTQANTNFAWQVACSDDSNPPGGVSSAVRYMLKPNRDYILVADSYAVDSTGVYQLNVSIVAGCVPNCDGALCGASGCPGVSCGECDAGQTCALPSHRCQATICLSDCSGRVCGDDGCGGSCGSCSSSHDCVSTSTGSQCVFHQACNSLQPVCTGCRVGQFCGTDCACWDNSAAIMDLSIDVTVVDPYIDANVTFAESSCAVEHGCVGGLINRRLLRFTSNVLSLGRAPYNPPNPPELYPWFYEWNECHGHYHTRDALLYRLLRASDRSEVLVGQKKTYCMEDSAQLSYFNAPNVFCTGNSTCDHQGLSIGWYDQYGPTLDCQWIDITDLNMTGNFILQQCINPHRQFQESTFDNNCIETPITLSATGLTLTSPTLRRRPKNHNRTKTHRDPVSHGHVSHGHH